MKPVQYSVLNLLFLSSLMLRSLSSFFLPFYALVVVRRLMMEHCFSNEAKSLCFLAKEGP
jgi:hypothetical protein